MDPETRLARDRAVRRLPRRRIAGAAPRTGWQRRRSLTGCRPLRSIVRLDIRRQRQRPGVVSAGEFHQRLHPGFHRGMGREQVGKTLARIVEAQFHHRRGGAGKFAAALDLAQRRDHGVGVFGQFDRAGIGQQFARPRQRQPHQLRQQPRQPISATAMMMTTIAPPPDLLLSPSEDDDEDDHDRRGRNIQPKLVKLRKNSSAKKPTTPAMITAITIICTSPLRMWVSSWPSTASISWSLSAFNRPRGDGDGILPLVEPGRVGVQRVAFDDLQLRHRNAARDAEIFQQVIEPGLLLPRHVLAAGDGIDDRLVEEIGDHDPQHGGAGR